MEANQFLPSFETATCNGVLAPLGSSPGASTWLYTSRCLPSLSVTPSKPDALFGSDDFTSGDLVSPLSLDHDSSIARLRLRANMCNLPSLCMNIVGCIALNSSPLIGPTLRQVFP